MSEIVLLLDHREISMDLNGGALSIRRPQKKVQHVPLNLLGLVILIGNPQVSIRALRTLGEKNIPTVILPLRGEAGGTWLSGGMSNSIAVRIAQHRANDLKKLDIARSLIQSKLIAYQKVAFNIGWFKTANEFENYQKNSLKATDTEQLMGYEGAAANLWWSAWSQQIDPVWHFKGRNRRPPRDPINALLSLSYTLVSSEISAAIRAFGLDPALAFLHGIVPGRESLVFDLLEPLRAGIDQWIFDKIQSNQFQPDDFNRTASSYRLNKNARQKFYAQWAEARLNWQDPVQSESNLFNLCIHQVRWLRQQLGPYHPQTGAAYG